MLKEAEERIKVNLKDIQPNPYRNFDLYPISEEKVRSLTNSIKETGFWGNIIGREKGGKIEIAYGHHRLEALKKIFPPTKEIDISVKDYSDEEMIKVMADENDEVYSCVPGAVDDAVKAARDFLLKHPDRARKILSSGDTEVKRVRVGAPVITKFLGGNWTENKVENALERIRLVESGIVDAASLYKFPTLTSAATFCKAVKEWKIDKERQSVLSDRIVKEGRYGERSMYEIVCDYNPLCREVKTEDAAYCEVQMRKVSGLIDNVKKELRAFMSGFGQVTILGGETSIQDISSITLDNFRRSIRELDMCINNVSKELERKQRNKDVKNTGAREGKTENGPRQLI